MDFIKLYQSNQCATTGLDVRKCESVVSAQFAVDILLLGDKFIVCKLSGKMNLADVKAYLARLDQILTEIKTPAKVVLVEDCLALRQVDLFARKAYFEWLKIRDLVCGVVCLRPSTTFQWVMSTGAKLYGIGKFFKFAAQLSDALKTACSTSEQNANEQWIAGTRSRAQSVLVETSRFRAKLSLCRTNVFLFECSGSFIEEEDATMLADGIEKLMLLHGMEGVRHYRILDWEKLAETSPRARRAYVRLLNDIQMKFPCVGTYAFGLSSLSRAIIHVSRLFLPAPVTSVTNLNEALERIARQSTANQSDETQIAHKLMNYLSQLHFNPQKASEIAAEFAEEDPFRAVIEGIQLMRHDYEHLLLERQSVEAELKECARKAEAANAAKGQFLAQMSYQLRTPLSGVIGMANLLLDTPLDEEQVEFAESLKSSANSLLGIIGDVLDYSRLETNHIKLQREVVGIGQLIREVELVSGTALESKSTKLNITINKDVPAFVFSDPARLRQILLQLTLQGIERSEKGLVRLSLDTKDGFLHFEVADRGKSIDPLHLAKLLQSTEPSLAGGDELLLGFVVSAQLIRLMGGDIEVHADPDKGNVVHFWVPNDMIEEQAQPQVVPDAHSVEKVKLRILLAEDNPINLKVAQKTLQKLGHEVGVAVNGREALESMSNSTWDLVLMDVQMPEMNGLEATRRWRALEPKGTHLPILALTAHALESDKQVCIEAGMDEYLTKPLQSSALQEALGRWGRVITEQVEAVEGLFGDV